MINKETRFKVTSFDKIQEEEISWLWKPYFPFGCISIIVGDPGVGKSFIATYMASVISKGGTFFNCTDKLNVGEVIIKNKEDSVGGTLKKRLTGFNADQSMVHVIELKNADDFSGDLLLDDFAEIDKIIDEVKPILVILDPLTSFLGDIDMNSAVKVRNVLTPIVKIARKHECAIILISHRNKNTHGTNQLNRIMGSVDFGGIARSVVSIGKKNGSNEVLFMHTKSNLAEKGKTLAFEIKNDNLEWIGTRDYIIDDEEDSNYSNKISKIDEAKHIIIDYLNENVESKFSDICDFAKTKGISESTLTRARGELKSDNIVDNKYVKKNDCRLVLV